MKKMFYLDYEYKNDKRELSLALEKLNISINDLRNIEVSNENIINTVMDVFSNSFNSLRSTINNSLKKFFDDKQELIMLNATDYKRINREKMSSNYAHLLYRQVTIPAGMTSTYLQYSTCSFSITLFAKQVSSIVEQLRSDIGRVISTDNGLKDSTLFTDSFYVSCKKEMNKLLDNLGKYRTGDDFNSVSNYGDVFLNNREFFDTCDMVIKGNENINTIDRKKLLNSIETTMNYIQKLSTIAKTKGFSKPLVESIANSVSVVAEIVEVFSSMVFNQKMLNSAINSVIDEVGGII